MNVSTLARQLPLRISAGAFILNSGLSKRNADESTASQLQGFATTTYPFLGKLEPRRFAAAAVRHRDRRRRGAAGTGVPAGVAGIALTGFSVGLFGLYLKTSGMRQEGSLRPTQQGIALAKDVWMLGIGAALVADGLLDPPAGGRGTRR